ncbi:MAG: hypothetical protein KDC98_14550 [Planctomycetes bacterium]|nr:hypothetical protein [Planctomycetota bacterium]
MAVSPACSGSETVSTARLRHRLELQLSAHELLLQAMLRTDDGHYFGTAMASDGSQVSIRVAIAGRVARYTGESTGTPVHRSAGTLAGLGVTHRSGARHRSFVGSFSLED